MSDATGRGWPDGLLDALAATVPIEMTERVTDRGLEITFHPSDPLCAGGGTLIIPKGSPLAG